MSNKTISIVMPIYNQEDIIESILDGIYNNISDSTKECIYILDGCVDNTEFILWNTLKKHMNSHVRNKVIYADDVNEVISCNLGFKMSECDYSLNLQDDMLITEKDFDKRMMKPFQTLDNVLGVTARNAQNELIDEKNGKKFLQFFNVAGKDVGSPRNIFSIRDVIVRGPILWDNAKLKELDYLDEDFVPITNDDKDISFRGYKNGYVVGSYVIDYISDPRWGVTRKPSYTKEKREAWQASSDKNEKLIMERHLDLLSGEKHDEDIIIE